VYESKVAWVVRLDILTDLEMHWRLIVQIHLTVILYDKDWKRVQKRRLCL